MLVACASARAEWLEASSDHFVVYGDTDEKNLRRFAEQLERYDAAMAAVTGVPRSKPTRSARVTIYLAGSEAAVRRLYGQNGDDPRYVAGFYVPQLTGPMAFVPQVRSAREGTDLDFSMIVLLHEYAHHFNYANSRFPVPRWMSEGAAEFFASAGFEPDGSVTLGRPANHRGDELFMAPDVTVTDLVDPEHYEKRKGKSQRYDGYYGRAWLLYHYLTFEPARNGQLRTYINALVAGTPSRDAAVAAFGDLGALDREIDGYMTRRRMKVVTIKADALPIGDIAVRRLRPGEAAIMPVAMRSDRGVSKSTAAAVLSEARTIAAKFPDDPAVLAALAEAQHDAGEEDAAVTTADAAIARDPSNINAHVQKGLALFSKARATGDAATMAAANNAFFALNRIENDHPVPLFYFYLSFVTGGGKPSANAIAALEKAVRIAPFAQEASLMLAHQRLVDGRRRDARRAILPVASNPHAGKLGGRLREFLARLDATADGDTATLAAEFETIVKSDEDDGEDGSKISVQRTDRDVLEGRPRR